MKYLLFSLIFSFSILINAQRSFQVGAGLGVDIGLRSDYTEDYILKRENSSSISTDILCKYETAGMLDFYPVISVTIINFNFGMENKSGIDNPEGRILSVENTGNIPSDQYEVTYLSRESKGKTARFSVGGIVSYEFIRGLEIGSGCFYTMRRTVIRDYSATDTYEYFGASGSHTDYYQTDEYEYLSTEIEKKDVNYFDILANEVSIPLLAKYNFRTDNGMTFSPYLLTFFGADVFYKLGFCYTIDLNVFNR